MDNDNQTIKSGWVLLGLDDPQKLLIGKVEVESHVDVKHYLKATLGTVTWKLVDACQLAFLAHQAEDGMQMIPATLPISGAQGPATVYIRPEILMFVEDLPGLRDNVERLMSQFNELTMVGRARSAGVVIPGRR